MFSILEVNPGGIGANETADQTRLCRMHRLHGFFQPFGRAAFTNGPQASASRLKEAIGKTIQDLEAQLRIAYLKSDSGWLDQHLSDAYIEIDEDGTVKSRTDLVQAFRTADLAYDVVNLSEGSARIFNGDAVLLVQKEELQGGLRGHNFSGLFRCTHVWIKMNGQWQLASSQLTRVAK